MRASFLFLLPSVLFVACGGEAVSVVESQRDGGTEDSSVPPDATEATADAPDDEPATWDQVTSCPDGMGPTMVLLPAGFCIDSTEVTRGQYRAWLDTNPSLDGQIDRCSQWNDSFASVDWCEDNYSWGCVRSDCPQTCIDRCDAYAFCKAAGRHLCGKMGGGPLADWNPNGTPSDATNPSRSQWYHACSANGENTYPYGDIYGKKTCNGESTVVTILPVGSKPDCQSSTAGYEGVFDLSGNVDEHEDNCLKADETEGPMHDGSDDQCTKRGGGAALTVTAEDYACTAVIANRRASIQSFGFRCCYP